MVLTADVTPDPVDEREPPLFPDDINMACVPPTDALGLYKHSDLLVINGVTQD